MNKATPAAAIQVVSNARELAREAAGRFTDLATAAVSKRGLFTVALSGGSTPRRLYELLADEKEGFREYVPWDKTHFFWTDERHVPSDHPDSNYRMTYEAMLSQVPVLPQNIHRIQSEKRDASEAAAEYEEVLRRFFQVADGAMPRFDLVLLGLGEEGHTASIFPGSEVLKEQVRLVSAPWVEKFKSYRITLTLPVLNNAAFVIFLVSGEGKAEIVREVLLTDSPVPAKAIAPHNGELLWLVDQAAARLLGSG
jgi:6-phosphogluconolactonase